VCVCVCVCVCMCVWERERERERLFDHKFHNPIVLFLYFYYFSLDFFEARPLYLRSETALQSCCDLCVWVNRWQEEEVNTSFSLCLCVCVCVCARESKREIRGAFFSFSELPFFLKYKQNTHTHTHTHTQVARTNVVFTKSLNMNLTKSVIPNVWQISSNEMRSKLWMMPLGLQCVRVFTGVYRCVQVCTGV